jgi:hypothetical protein
MASLKAFSTTLTRPQNAREKSDKADEQLCISKRFFSMKIGQIQKKKKKFVGVYQ